MPEQHIIPLFLIAQLQLMRRRYRAAWSMFLRRLTPELAMLALMIGRGASSRYILFFLAWGRRPQSGESVENCLAARQRALTKSEQFIPVLTMVLDNDMRNGILQYLLTHEQIVSLEEEFAINGGFFSAQAGFARPDIYGVTLDDGELLMMLEQLRLLGLVEKDDSGTTLSAFTDVYAVVWRLK